MSSGTADRCDPVTIPRQAGIYVRRAREAQGLTRRQLAEAAHVSERLLAALELGDAPGIGLDKLLAVLDALGLKLEVRGCPEASNPWDVPAKPRRATTVPPRSAQSHPTPRQRKRVEQPPASARYQDVFNDFLTNDLGINPASVDPR